MNRAIFRYEFKSRLPSVLTWAASASLVILIYAAIFPSFAKDAAILNRTMANFPAAFRAAFGIGEQDLSSVLGYFSFMYLFLQLILAVQAANYGIGLVSTEERELTADFLLTRPVTRFQIITSKLLAVLANLALTHLIVWLASFFFLNLFRGEKTFEPTTLLMLLAGLMGFQLFFLSVGLFITLLLKRVRSVTPYSLTLAFGMYALAGFSDMQGDSLLEKLTPFKHFNPNVVVSQGHFDGALVSISAIAVILSIVGSYWLYARRDIHAVT